MAVAEDYTGPNAELLYASLDGDVAWVEKCRKKGMDILNSRFKDGMSCILYACKYGYVELLDYLLAKGANPNDEEYCGGTCLMAAACYGRVDCVKRLISAGANVNCSYVGDNATMIYMLVYVFSREVEENGDGEDVFEQGSKIRTIEVLLEAGAPCNVPNIWDGKNALDILNEMNVDGMDRARRERDGLIAILQSIN